MSPAYQHVISMPMRVCLMMLAIWVGLAAMIKISAPEAFADALWRQGVFTADLQPIVAWAIPIIELLIAFLVLRDVTLLRLVARPALVLACTFAAFAGYAFVLVLSPPAKPAPCGCGFSQAPIASWSEPCIRNAAVAVALAMTARFFSAMDRSRCAAT